MNIYIINCTDSEGFYLGNESFPYASADPEKVIRQAYSIYKEVYDAGAERLSEDAEEKLSLEKFSEIMNRGFEGDTGFVSNDSWYTYIQFDDSHAQFEPYVVEV